MTIGGQPSGRGSDHREKDAFKGKKEVECGYEWREILR